MKSEDGPLGGQNADGVDALVDAKWVANEKSYEKCESPGRIFKKDQNMFHFDLF